MKLFFTKTDSLYKILKTLERVPPHKATEIFIDPEHAFFDNPWRGKQVQEIITKRKLTITFLAEKDFNRKFFQQLGLQVQTQQERPILRILRSVSLFFFNIKKFHLQTYESQQYLLYYLIFGLEVVLGLMLAWFLMMFLVPKADITIKVAQQSEEIIYNFRYYLHTASALSDTIKQLSIPYYTWALHYQYRLAISTDNIHHITNPSSWRVKIYNRTPSEFRLLANTRFITNDGVVFTAPETITIPAGSSDAASELKVKLVAAEYDESWVMIGVRGNIPRNTRLKIRNIKDSYFLDTIWAESIDDFQWGSTTSLGIVSEKDHQVLQQKIIDGVYKDKLNIVKREFKAKNSIILFYDPMVKTTFHEINIEGKIWDKATTLAGTAQVSFDFYYLKWEDIVSAFSKYVRQRHSESVQLMSIDPNTLGFVQDQLQWMSFWASKPAAQPATGAMKLFETQQDDVDSKNLEIQGYSWFILPTKVVILQGYDFQKDSKHLLNAIKSKIAGKNIEEARKVLQSYPEISSVSISLGLFGGEQIPTIKSRIHINVEL